MNNSAKSFLIISRHAPCGSSHGRDALDVALTIAAFEQPLSLLYMDDGVFQLLSDQDTSAIEQKNVSQTLPMLAMYDIDQVYVDNSSLKERNLSVNDLCIPVTVLRTPAASKLLQEHDIVLGF